MNLTCNYATLPVFTPGILDSDKNICGKLLLNVNVKKGNFKKLDYFSRHTYCHSILVCHGTVVENHCDI